MPKSRKKSVKPSTSAAATRRRNVLEGLRSAIADGGAAYIPLPSHDAMGLAEMVLNRLANKKRKEVTQVVVAEMLESAISVRRAAAESHGLQKGIDEALEKMERQIIEGIMCRVDVLDNVQRLPPTIQVATLDMQVLVKALYKAGYRGAIRGEGIQRQVWTVRRNPNGDMEARHESV